MNLSILLLRPAAIPSAHKGCSLPGPETGIIECFPSSLLRSFVVLAKCRTKGRQRWTTKGIAAVCNERKEFGPEEREGEREGGEREGGGEREKGKMKI